MKRVSVIGHFAYGKEYLDGQTVKTKIVAGELTRILGESEVGTLDTHGGKKKLLSLPFLLLRVLKSSKNVIMLPAHNGLRVITPLLFWENKLFGRRLHYVVIGGWLPEFLSGRLRLAKKLKHFDGIYVETETMRAALAAQGFENVFVLPNCKELKSLTQEELVYPEGEPYRLCTFSRVMREKGIEDAVVAVKRINEEMGRTVCTLDIYGQIDPGQTEWFDTLQEGFGENIRYGGLVSFDRSVEVLKDYFALLFPTYYMGEGFAGTVIDALAAGIPIVASDWRYNSEIVGEDVGFLFETKNVDALVSLLREFAEHPERVTAKKLSCLSRSKKYSTKTVFNEFVQYLK